MNIMYEHGLLGKGANSGDIQALVTIVNEAEANNTVIKTNMINKVDKTLPTSSAWNDVENGIQNSINVIKNKMINQGVNVIANPTLKEVSDTLTTMQNPWLHDWSAYETICDWSETTKSLGASSYGTMLDITNEEGYLTYLRGYSNSQNTDIPIIRMTVDGVVYLFEGATTLSAYQGNMLTKPIYYKQSLKVEFYNTYTATISMICDHTRLKKVGNPNINKQTLLDSSFRKMARGNPNTTSYSNIVSVTGSGYLLDILGLVRYSSVNATLSLSVEIDGVAICLDKTLVRGDGYQSNAYISGAIRFNSSLVVKVKLSSTGSYANCHVWYTLD